MPLLDPDNHLFGLARSGRRLPPAWLALVMALVFVFGGQIIGSIIGLPIFVTLGGTDVPPAWPPVQSAAMQAAILIVTFTPVALLIALWMRLYEGRPFWAVGLERAGWGRRSAIGALVGLAMFAAALGLWAAFGFLAAEDGDPARQGAAALGGVALVFLGWAVQGAVEEILCRGWLMPVIGARTRPWLGLVASAVFFAALHSLNPNLNPVAILNLALFGLFTGLYALWERGLWGVCAMHAAWNWAQGNLFGIEVSGTAPGGGILFNMREAGPDIVTGGAFGAEGGLAVTAVLLVATAVVAGLAVSRQGRGIHHRGAEGTETT
jgi:membrane protease YdiL (CAAX protease family)